MAQVKSGPATAPPATGILGALSALFGPQSFFYKPLVSAFILWQLLMISFWLLPPSATQQLLLNTLHNYMWWTGNDQNWGMFSPQPANVDIYMQAKITYQDGTQKTWTFPRMHAIGYVQRYQEERFRKMIENAHQDVNSGVWPSVARFAALANNKEPKTNPVVHVELIRDWQPIPPPGDLLPAYNAYTFYRADYAPGSLPQ
ncbi:MAG TPA: hypothetical protein VFW40_11675 [Capsulimonadaceae bacterium]|nr:hypothetical protein [Capsulimonadaceae bacterium]